MKTPKKLKAVYIKWFDASYTGSQQAIEEMDTDFVLESIGRYVKEDKKYITLAVEYVKKYNIYRHIHHIPKVNIIKKRVIKI